MDRYLNYEIRGLINCIIEIEWYVEILLLFYGLFDKDWLNVIDEVSRAHKVDCDTLKYEIPII
jgi:hypothetical protein